MNYDDLYLLKLIKRHEQMLSLALSRLSSIEINVSGFPNIYEVYTDPTTSGLIPLNPLQPAIALFYDSVTKEPINSFWWQVDGPSGSRWI